MEMTRKKSLETDFKKAEFQIGDTFVFEMADGEMVEVIAVEQINGDMVFTTTDCLKKEYPMYDKHSENGYINYEESDLRKHLNNEILTNFPHEIREKMTTFDNGDYLRPPTEKEIFGVNKYSEEEALEVTQFECMKQRRNRIAFQGYGSDELEWYWLANKKSKSNSYFCYCDYRGYGSCYSASLSGGVRLVFKLENNRQGISANNSDNSENSKYKNIYVEYLEKEYEKTISDFEQVKEMVIQKINDMTAVDAVELGAAYASNIDKITNVATKLQTISEMLESYEYFG